MSGHCLSVQSSLSWVPASDGWVPDNAVCVGGDIYVIRAKVGQEVIPGKLRKYHNACVAYECNEHEFQCYEVLVDTGLHFFVGG